MAAPAMPREGLQVPGIDPDNAVQILPPDVDRRVWLAMRRTGIGSSEPSALLGFTNLRAPVELWEDKTGRIPLVDKAPSEEAEMGQLLEPVVRDRFARVHQVDVRASGMLRSTRWPWMLANPDGLVSDGSGYEGKTCGANQEVDWGTTTNPLVPDHPELQSQWCMAVTGLPGWWVACLIAGQRNVYRYVHRDDELIRDLVSISHQWWQTHVIGDQRPPADGSAAWTRYLRRRFPLAAPGSEVQIGPEDSAALRAERKAAIAAERAAKRSHDDLKNRVRLLLGNAERLVSGDHQIATWKHTKRFKHSEFAKAEPDLYQQYITQVDTTDVARLAEEHPEIFLRFCSRELRITD